MNNFEKDYMHGYCHEWALDHYRNGDKFFIVLDYNYDIESSVLIHAGLYRNKKYIDATHRVNDILDILDDEEDGFDYNDPEVQILTYNEYINFLKDFNLIG